MGPQLGVPIHNAKQHVICSTRVNVPPFRGLEHSGFQHHRNRKESRARKAIQFLLYVWVSISIYSMLVSIYYYFSGLFSSVCQAYPWLFYRNSHRDHSRPFRLFYHTAGGGCTLLNSVHPLFPVQHIPNNCFYNRDAILVFCILVKYTYQTVNNIPSWFIQGEKRIRSHTRKLYMNQADVED
jgi:hypothetical protein